MVMIRRTFLTACAATTAALVAGSALAAPQAIKMGYIFASHSHQGAAAKAWADSVQQATGGSFVVKQFPSSALGGERELIEGLQLGTLEAAIVSTGALNNFVAEVGVVDIPFLFRDTQHARTVLDGQFGQELLAKFQKRGLVALAWGEQGFRHLTNSKHAVQSVADMRGLKLRVSENPIHITALRTLGAKPAPMSWPEVISALQQHTIDGQENPIAVLMASRLWEVQKYLTLTGHVYSPMVLMLSPRFWDSLSDAHKAVFAQAARRGAQASRAFVDEIERQGVEQAKQHGMQVVHQVDRQAFRQALAPAYKQYAKRFGQDTLDAIANVK